MNKEETAQKLEDEYGENAYTFRADGHIEWICSHDVGHTVWYPKGSDMVHGCCGCCKELKGKFRVMCYFRL